MHQGMCVHGGGGGIHKGECMGEVCIGMHTPGDVHGSGDAQDCVQWGVCIGLRALGCMCRGGMGGGVMD